MSKEWSSLPDTMPWWYDVETTNLKGLWRVWVFSIEDGYVECSLLKSGEPEKLYQPVCEGNGTLWRKAEGPLTIEELSLLPAYLVSIRSKNNYSCYDVPKGLEDGLIRSISEYKYDGISHFVVHGYEKDDAVCRAMETYLRYKKA